MEPNALNTAHPAPDSPPKARRRWPLSPKITGIVVAVLIIGIGGGFFLLKSGSGSRDDASDESLYIQREGYPHVDAVGDPIALTANSTSKVVQFNGQNVLQPCDLLSLQDLAASGLRLNAGLEGAVERNYFDGVGQATNLKSMHAVSLPLSDDSNHCQYALQNYSLINVEAFQSGYVDPTAMQYTLSRLFSAVNDVEGLKVYKQKPSSAASPSNSDDSKDVTYVLRSSIGDVQLRMRLGDTASQDKVLKTVAGHLAKAQTTPTPPQAMSYKSPIFTAQSLSSCELIDNAFFKAIHGVDAGPLVLERFFSSVNVIEQGKKRYNYTSYECKRMAEDHNAHRTVRIVADSYESEEGAKADFAFKKTSPVTRNVQSVTPTIGDESFYGDVASADNAITFRKGKVLVSVSYYLPGNANQITPEERIQTLAPLIQDALRTRWQLH